MRMTLYMMGILLMALPGLLKTGTRFWFIGCMTVGTVLLIIATVKRGVTKPRTALQLLIISNLSFWLAIALLPVRNRLFGAPPIGVHPFDGPLALWSLVFIVLVIYEVAIFLRGLLVKGDRLMAIVGLAAVVVQGAITLRSIYMWIQGS